MMRLWLIPIILISTLVLFAGEIAEAREWTVGSGEYSSRAAGYPGYEGTVEEVENLIEELGFERAVTQHFNMAVPVDRGGFIKIGDDKFQLRQFSPNMISFGASGENAIEGEVIYIGGGELSELPLVDLADKIVAMDLVSGRNWLNIANLGARAIIFLQPEDEKATYREYNRKVLRSPVEFPRLFMPREEVAGFLRAVGDGNKSVISTDAKWENIRARNISVYIPGERSVHLNGDDAESEFIQHIHVNLDAVSLVPALAPGGETLYNLRVIEDFLRGIDERPLPMSVVVTFFTGNHHSLIGARHFIHSAVSGQGPVEAENIAGLASEINSLKSLKALITEDVLNDPLPFLREISGDGMRHRHPLLIRLQSLISIELAQISERVVAEIEAGEELGLELEDVDRTVEELGRRREELNYLGLLRWRGYRPITDDEEIERHPLVRLFRARDADRPDDPELIASAKPNLSQFLKELRDRLGGIIADKELELERLHEGGKLAEFFENKRIVFNVGVDIGSRSRGLVLGGESDLYRSGYFNSFRRSLGFRMEEYVARFNAERGVERAGRARPRSGDPMINALAEEFGENWRNYVHYPVYTAGEVFTMVELPGVNLCGSADFRGYFDTPEDALIASDERIAMGADGLRWLVESVDDILLNDLKQPRRSILPQPFNPGNDRWGKVWGRAIRPAAGGAVAEGAMDGARGSLALIRRNEVKQGQRGNLIVKVDEAGAFVFPMIPTLRAPVTDERKEVRLYAFRLNEQGEIDMAMDEGLAGSAYPQRFVLRTRDRGTSLLMFDCRSLGVLNAFDPRTFRPLSSPRIYAGRGNIEQRQYGVVSTMEPDEASAACFVHRRGRMKLIFPGPAIAARMLLLNSSEGDALGEGFAPGGGRIIRHPEWQSAHDMWRRSDSLLQSLMEAGIQSGFMVFMRDQAQESIEAARAALVDGRYDEYLSEAAMAWSLSSRNYPEIMGLTNSSVRGLVFYLFMIIPFALLTERLLFSFNRILIRFIAVVVTGMVLYVIISRLHPGFEVAGNPLVLFIAFALMSLTAYVMIILWSRFEGYVSRWKARGTGLVRRSMARGAAFGVALSVGAGNMRRAPSRTALTIISLTLFTVVVISLVSVRASLSLNIVRERYSPSFDGLMVRDRRHEELPENLPALLLTFYGKESSVYERRISMVRLDWTPEWSSDGAISGLPESVQRMLLTEGEPLGEEPYACILPHLPQEEAGIDIRELVGETIEIGGIEIMVAGVFDPERYNGLVGLDGSRLTPVDLDELEDLRQMFREMGQEDLEITPPHLSATRTVIVTGELMDLIDSVRDGVFLTGTDNNALRAIAGDLVLRTDFDCYMGEDGRAMVFSSTGRPEVRGLADIAIPVVICAMIIINTMFGAVASQMRHIPTFSAVGLAPKHIAGLFLVESLIYSVIAVVLGYITGQVAAIVIAHYELIPGMVLDYSSESALLGCLIVIAVMMLSTAYPAYKAMTEATPGGLEEEKPSFDGDYMYATLPFCLTGAQAPGAVAFLYEFIAEHTDIGTGSFYVEEPVFGRTRGRSDHDELEMRFKMWLAPIDLGNSQKAGIQTETDQFEVMHLRVEAWRETGDINSWQKCNQRWLTDLRKQMLLWRLVEPEEKEKYIKMAEGL